MVLTTKHKKTIIIAGGILFIGTFIALIMVFFTSVKKDNTIDIYKARIEEKEKARQDMIEDRKLIKASIEQRDVAIALIDRVDSMMSRQQAMNNQKVPIINKYYNEKTAAINNYSSADLFSYFSNLK